MMVIEIIHKLYKLTLSPFLESVLGVKCRFYPCCSDYAAEAIKCHGWIKGIKLAVLRFLRCAPYCQGGHDPVIPQKTSGK